MPIMTQGVTSNEVIRILTYNVWFNQVTKERMSHIFKVLEDSGADFICL